MKKVHLIYTRLSLLLRERRAEGFVGTLVNFLIIMTLVAGFIYLMPLFTTKQNVDYMACQLMRTIELSGEVGAEYQAELNRMKEQTNLSPSVSVSATYVADNKIQLRERISITVSVVMKIPLLTPTFSDPVTIDVPVSKTVSGISEVYWKV